MLEGSDRPRWLVRYDQLGKALIVLNFIVLLVSTGIDALNVWPWDTPSGPWMRLGLVLGSTALWLLMAIPRITSGQGILMFFGPGVWIWIQFGVSSALLPLVGGVVMGASWSAVRTLRASPPPPRPLLEQVFVRRSHAARVAGELEHVFE